MDVSDPLPATLLADPRLHRLWARARARLEATGGVLVGSFVVRAPSEDERAAIQLLLGERRRGRDVQVRLEDLDGALGASRLGIGLVALLELEAPLRDRRSEATKLEGAVDEAIDQAMRSPLSGEPWFGEWLRDAERDGVLTRLVKSGQAGHVVTAVRVLERLPEDGIPLPILAGDVTNDAKALDRGPLATLLLRALALRAGRPRPVRSDERRMLWETFGVVMDDLASQVLVFNLDVIPRTPLGQWLAAAARDGVPFRITLHQLTTYGLEPRPAVVRICENPAVLRAAAARFGRAGGAMVCTEGQPSVAFARLAQLLVRAGCELWTHGDFDWPGVRIVGALLRYHGARPWRMTADDYRAAVAGSEVDDLQALAGDAAPTPWDATLAERMRETGRVVFEEMVVQSLLGDVDPGGACDDAPTIATVAQIVALARCAHKIHLDVHGDPADRLATSAFLEFLWSERSDRLNDVTTDLRGVADVDGADDDERSARTLAALRRGAPWVRGGWLAGGGLAGAPDLLEREEIPSRLGAFGYRPVIIRAAGAFEDDEHKTIKVQYAVELCGYADLLGRVQGRRPITGTVVDRDGKSHAVELRASWPEYEERRARALRIARRAERTSPAWKQDCHLCPWQRRCYEDLVRSDDLTLIPDLGETHRANLASLGVTTRAELASADPAFVDTAPGVGAVRAERFIRQAKVQRDGTPLILDHWERPAPDLEVAYDVEEFTPRRFVYLHGLLFRRRGGDAHFAPVCAEAADSEESTWLRFLAQLDALGERDDYVVYVYSHHERSVITRLAARYGSSDSLDAFCRRMVDVHEAARRVAVFPTISTGLKAIARLVGFEWRDEDPGGAESMAWWAQYLRDPAGNVAARDRVLRYNEDDLRATFAIVDWLAARAP